MMEILLDLVTTGLLIIKRDWRHSMAFPSNNILAPLMIHALDAALSKTSVVMGTGLVWTATFEEQLWHNVIDNEGCVSRVLMESVLLDLVLSLHLKSKGH